MKSYFEIPPAPGKVIPNVIDLKNVIFLSTHTDPDPNLFLLCIRYKGISELKKYTLTRDTVQEFYKAFKAYRDFWDKVTANEETLRALACALENVLFS